MERHSTLIIIPAYNEEKTIGKVIEESISFGDILVINDCSVDRTEEIARSYNINIINNPQNLGYTKGILKGLFYALEHNYHYAITIDGDGQHETSILKHVINLLNSQYEIVLTVRNHQARFSEYFYSLITAVLLGIKDPLSGIKGFNLKKINSPVRYCSTKMFAIDFLLNYNLVDKSTYQLGYSVIPRVKGESSRLGNSLAVNIKIIIAALMFIQVYISSKINK